MAEEAAEMHKEEWEKQPILPDGKLPCEECGDRTMYPLVSIQRYDYLALERLLANETEEPTYERIMEMYDEKQLCCILHHHDVPYSYSYKKGLQNLQQSKIVMAWQVQRMVSSSIDRAVKPSMQHGRVRSHSKLAEGHETMVFTRRGGTNWEHAVEELQLSNPGRSVGNRKFKTRNSKRRQHMCPQIGRAHV